MAEGKLEKVLVATVQKDGVMLDTPEDGLSDLDIILTINTLFQYLRQQGYPIAVLEQTAGAMLEKMGEES